MFGVPNNIPVISINRSSPYLLKCSVVGDGLVFAVRTSNAPSGANPLPFESTHTVSGNRWNTDTHSFSVHEAQGLYFVGLSVGTETSTPVNYTLVLSGQHFGGITRTSTAHGNQDPIRACLSYSPFCSRYYAYFKSMCC